MASQRCGECSDLAPMKSGYVSEFRLTKMDCLSEERLVRTALAGLQPAVSAEFDLPNRIVRVYHKNNLAMIEEQLVALGLGATRLGTSVVSSADLAKQHAKVKETDRQESRILKILLAINSVMFGAELTVGWLAQSTGLIADSLDMFADAAIYGVALYAVGHSARLKIRAAHLSGWLQLLLALGALFEVGRRFVFGSEPASLLMMSFGLIALTANRPRPASCGKVKWRSIPGA